MFTHQIFGQAGNANNITIGHIMNRAVVCNLPTCIAEFVFIFRKQLYKIDIRGNNNDKANKNDEWKTNPKNGLLVYYCCL